MVTTEMPLECRSCLESEGELHNLFDAYQKMYFLPQIILECTGVEVTKSSDYALISPIDVN